MNRIIEMIKMHEGTGPVKNGERLMPYQDSVGLTTLGYGRNVEERGISFDEADYLLSNDVADVVKDCSQFTWFKLLDDVRQAVVVDMVFNIGIKRFKGFKNTIASIESGDYVMASIEMLDSKWASQVGQRAQRLSKMMSTGEWYED